jgi:hypothetical protein
MRTTGLVRPALALALLAGLVGCRGADAPAPPGYGSEDGQQIARLVDELNEAKPDPGKLKKLYPGAPAGATKQYDPYRYEVTGQPAVSGDTATAQIRIVKDTDGQERGTKEWTFEKVGGAWKVKTAPLP